MTIRRPQIPRTARRPRRSVALAVGLAGAALALALVATAAGGPRSAQAKCPLKDGTLDIFSTTDVSAVAGDIGPAQIRWIKLAEPDLNKGRGILGCKVKFTIQDEPLPNFQSGLRKYRAAIASGKYDVFFALFDSALLRALPRFTNAAHKILIAASVGDHQPFYQNFQKYNIQAGPSTLSEARASAVYAKSKGWKRIAIMTPNYAYGQDVAKAFEDYFVRIVPGGKIVTRQFPAFLEKNLTPYINAVVASKPDAVFGGEYGPDVLTAWKAWKSLNLTLPTIWAADLSVLEQVSSPDIVPKNSYGFERGNWRILKDTPRGRIVFNAYRAAYGKTKHPYPTGYVFDTDSGIQLMRALAEKTQSIDADKWIAAIEKGNFTYTSAYENGPTKVDPISHVADVCATVGRIAYDPAVKQGSYVRSDTKNLCVHDVITEAETKKITKR